MSEVKVSDNLLEIVKVLEEAMDKVRNAYEVYAQVLEELVSFSYRGSAIDALTAYFEYICVHMKTLAELYDKICQFINYTYEEMCKFDKNLALLIEKQMSGLMGGLN